MAPSQNCAFRGDAYYYLFHFRNVVCFAYDTEFIHLARYHGLLIYRIEKHLILMPCHLLGCKRRMFETPLKKLIFTSVKV